MEAQCEFSDYCIYYQCTVSAVHVTEANTEIKWFRGAHRPNKSDKDVTKLVIENQIVRFFPKNLHIKFPNLVWLWITSCGLEKISKIDLAGLKNLESLNLSSNKLTSLPDDLFADMKKLEYIYFNDNKLEVLSSKLLKPIENTLKFANFENNVKINDYCQYNSVGKGNLQQLMATIDRQCTPPEAEIKRRIDENEQKAKRLDNLSSNFENFRISGKYSDFTITVRGKEYKVHKNILAAQSSVFDELFTADTDEQAKTFTNIKNFSKESFESFLNYFYTGRVDPGVDAVEIFELALEFKVAGLRSASVEKILENLDEDNALKIFNLGKQHASDDLAQSAYGTLKGVYPDLTDALIDDPGSLNEIIEYKQKIAAILKASIK